MNAPAYEKFMNNNKNAHQPMMGFNSHEHHPSLDYQHVPIDPARPLDDIPEPASDYLKIQNNLAHHHKHTDYPKALTPWQLIQSQALAEHLTLLQAGGLIKLPKNFFGSSDKTVQEIVPLPSGLEKMSLLDMADIHQICQYYPNLFRQGFVKYDNADNKAINQTENKAEDYLIANRLHAQRWQMLLYPHHFSEPVGGLHTDLLAISVANHVLKQSDRRQSINTQISAERICQHLRSYLLSQCVHNPAQSQAWQHIGLFVGHVIVAAIYQGYDMQVSQQGQVYFNLSSRTALLARYPVLSDYMTEGWHE